MKSRTRKEWREHDRDIAKREHDRRCSACRRARMLTLVNEHGWFCDFECYLDWKERQEIDAKRAAR